jgi:hypothetical protein
LPLAGRRSESVFIQERLRGWHRGNLLFGHRPYASSMVGLTEGWKSHSDGRGDVLSSWVPTAPGMVLQCSRWWRSGGDGRTGPMVTEETRLTGPTSQCHPVRVRGRRSYPFRGFWCPLSRVRRAGRMRVGGIVSRRAVQWPYRKVPYSGGDGLTRTVGEIAPGYDSQAVSVGRCGGDSSLT